MSTSYISFLTSVTQNVTIYLGLPMFIAGIFGGILNVLVFLSLKTFRQSSCAFYLTCMSFVNMLHLFTGLLTFIMINGFNTNWVDMSLVYCKFRPYFVALCVLTSFTCMCFATIDQFLATCSDRRWHQFNNIQFARYMVIGAVIFWTLINVPYVVYQDHILLVDTNTTKCVVTNIIFQKYLYVFYGPILIASLPVIIMTIFGVLAYRNVRQIAYYNVPLVRRELDKQLTTMVLINILFDVIVMLPLIVQNIPINIFNAPSNSDIATQLYLMGTISTVLYYFHFIGSFYIYVCVSKRFRQQLIYVLFTIHLRRWHPRQMMNNQIEPQI